AVVVSVARRVKTVVLRPAVMVKAMAASLVLATVPAQGLVLATKVAPVVTLPTVVRRPPVATSHPASPLSPSQALVQASLSCRTMHANVPHVLRANRAVA
ncbi:MAG: hypothetical protein KAX68_09325, partial [Giesbergeria sp.]|nr:hypothetical protein [Giesbergeria sp.]